jgi:hypothetical protein
MHFVEQQSHTVRQDLHLLLLQCNGHHAVLVHGLKKERSVARFTHGSGDESIRGAENMYCAWHCTSCV